LREDQVAGACRFLADAGQCVVGRTRGPVIVTDPQWLAALFKVAPLGFALLFLFFSIFSFLASLPSFLFLSFAFCYSYLFVFVFFCLFIFFILVFMNLAPLHFPSSDFLLPLPPLQQTSDPSSSSPASFSLLLSCAFVVAD
jgi:hypothetical protein